MELISIREYARRRGVSHVAVMKAAKGGRITLVDGKIDPTTADRDWPRNTDPSQQRVKPVPGVGQPPAEDVPTSGQTGGDGGPNYAKSRAVRETYMARLAALEYDVKKGKLINADETRSKIFKLGRTARDMMLALPDRLAPRLAGEADQFEVHRILTEEIQRVCNEIANARPV